MLFFDVHHKNKKLHSKTKILATTGAMSGCGLVGNLKFARLEHILIGMICKADYTAKNIGEFTCIL